MTRRDTAAKGTRYLHAKKSRVVGMMYSTSFSVYFTKK